MALLDSPGVYEELYGHAHPVVVQRDTLLHATSRSRIIFPPPQYPLHPPPLSGPLPLLPPNPPFARRCPPYHDLMHYPSQQQYRSSTVNASGGRDYPRDYHRDYGRDYHHQGRDYQASSSRDFYRDYPGRDYYGANGATSAPPGGYNYHYDSRHYPYEVGSSENNGGLEIEWVLPRRSPRLAETTQMTE